MSQIIWLASYPKSGNTWLRAFLANFLQNPPKPLPINDLGYFAQGDMDTWPYEKILGRPVEDCTVEEIYPLRPQAHRLLADVSPGIVFVKTHNRLAFFDDTATITPDVTFGAIYVIRNPMDVLISYARHYGISIDDAIDASGASIHFAPPTPGTVHQDIGSWSENVRSWTEAKGLYRYVMRYEDMLKNPVKTFGGIGKFLKTPHDRARIKKAAKFSSFKVLANQEKQGGFIEASKKAGVFFDKGRAGGWRNVLNREQIDTILHLHGDVMKEFGYLDENGDIVDG